MAKDFYWLNNKSRKFLAKGYLKEGQTAEERIREIADRAEQLLGIDGYSDKFFDYMGRGWYSLASPVWSNFGAASGLPISCNGTYVADNMASILEKVAEVGMMSKHGAGTSVFLGELRGRGADVTGGGKSSGPVHFAELWDTTAEVVSQSGVRRGNVAAYLPVEHPDIMEFLQIRNEGHAIQHMSIGVTITDAWFQSMIDGDADKQKVWVKIIQRRDESGYPYIFFTDTVNNAAPQVYKDKGMKIHASNLCTEICLASDAENSFVCDLSSMNLVHWDEWKETDAVETMIFFLDAVMTEYIEKATGIRFMESAVKFAREQRALGLGVLGWHSYLQENMIPFESFKAKLINSSIYKAMDAQSLEATKKLAVMFGEPELLKGYGIRNVTRLAIAPTTSSSTILGQVSPGIELFEDNYFVSNTAKGKYTYKNPVLKRLLAKKDKDTQEVWKDILVHGGSVQHLTFLTDHEKDVFKTFGEVSQKEIIIQAAQRQRYIDQAQSINLKIHPLTPVHEINALIIEAWKLGVKTLYYQKSTNPAQELGRSILACKSCEA